MDVTEKIKANLAAIKKIVFEEETETTQEETFVDVKAADGTILRIEPAVEVGATAKVVDEAGEMTDAADGDIELEDGTVISVEGGIVANVATAEIEEEMAEETKEEEDEAEKFDAEKFGADLEAKILASVDEKFSELLTKLSEVDERFTASTKLTVDLVEQLIEEPAAEPAKPSKNIFKTEDKKNKLVEQFTKTFKK